MSVKARRDVELIPFRRPTPESTLYVTGIPSALPLEEKWSHLYFTFSSFGLVNDVYLPGPQLDTPSSSSSSTGTVTAMSTEYGFVKFFSKWSAKRAQSKMDSKLFMAGKIVRVQFATRKQPSVSPSPVLHITQCYRLANCYLGFNGWSVHIRSMEEEEGRGEERSTKFVCEVELTLKGCEGKSVGRGEGDLASLNNKEISKVQALGVAKKQAFCRACEHAFSKVILAVLPSGRVTAKLLHSIDEELEGALVMDCPPVNVLPAEVPSCDQDSDTEDSH